MRILYFHQYFSTPSGSAGIRSYELARRMVERGHQVTMVTGEYTGSGYRLNGALIGNQRTGKIDGIDIIQFCYPYSNYQSIPRRSLTFLRFALSSMKIALTANYDVLFATSTPLTAALPGIVAKACRLRPFVFEVRDLWPELPKAMGVIRNPIILGAMAVLERLAYATADGAVALSPGIAKGIRRCGPAGLPIIEVPNAADLNLFQPASATNESPPQRTTFDALFTGAHGMANGLDALLDVAQELERRGRSDIRLRLIGDGKLKPLLMEQAQQVDLANIFFEDPMPKRQLAQELASAGVGLMILANVPAFYNGTSPNKFFDYIASGLPVINNYPGWLARMIEQEQCGIVVPPGDAAAFADALCFLADNPAERLEMGKRARKLAERQFSRERLASIWADFVEKAGRHG